METQVCLPLEPTQGDQCSNSDELVHPRGGGGSEDVRGGDQEEPHWSSSYQYLPPINMLLPNPMSCVHSVVILNVKQIEITSRQAFVSLPAKGMSCHIGRNLME